MMDVDTAGQSQTPGLNGKPTASPLGPLYDPLPRFQHLSLDSPSDQKHCYEHLQVSSQGFHRDLDTRSSRNSMIYRNNVAQSVQQVSPEAQVSSIVPGASQGRNIPPSFLPLMKEGTQPSKPYQMPSCSPHSPYQAISPPFPYMQRGLLNGPQSPHEKHLPISPLTFQQCANRSPQSPQDVFEGTNAQTADSAGYIHNRAALPSSPIQQHAQWTCSPHTRGTMNTFIPAQDRNIMPQSPNSESRYGLDPELLPSAKPLPVCREPDCVVGCSCCGAAMCPAMDWQDCGQRFYCPFCGKLSEVPWQHYQPTKGVDGCRVDKDKRPELSMGSYEILHSEKGEPAALLLAIDVSASALRGGHLEFVTQQIQTLLTSLNGEGDDAWSDVRVGLMTYDSRIHLYDLSPVLSRPHMLVIAETEELQLPVREGLLVSLKDCIHSINSVLQLIPQFSLECGDSGGVPIELSVRAGLAVLQALSCPGKLLIFHTAPLIEMGDTNLSSGFFGSNKPKSIFQPSEPALSLAKECIAQACGVYLFDLSQQDVGGAWPGHIPYLTGGALHTYSHLQGELDRERFSIDLKRTVEADTGYKAELRIFVSKDLRVSGCYGLFVPGPSTSRVALATLDWQTTLAVELAHNRALDETRGVVIQAVLSYSTQSGDRRTRVHTLTLRCSRHLQDAFRHYQAQTLLTFYCKKMYCAALERPLQDLREELQTEVTEALACYRKHCCSASVSAGQLVLPQYLRALPVYLNSLRKSEVLLPGLRSSVHQRLQQRCQVLSMDTCSTTTHFYPLLLPLPLSACSCNPPNPEQALRCCGVSLKPTGVYLVHAPLTLLIWVGTQVPASTLVMLFNTSCFSSLPSGETKLPILENPLSICIRSLINTLNSQAPWARKLWVVKQGDTCEEALQRHLVEDKSPNGGASYADFLYHLHVNSVRMAQ